MDCESDSQSNYKRERESRRGRTALRKKCRTGRKDNENKKRRTLRDVVGVLVEEGRPDGDVTVAPAVEQLLEHAMAFLDRAEFEAPLYHYRGELVLGKEDDLTTELRDDGGRVDRVFLDHRVDEVLYGGGSVDLDEEGRGKGKTYVPIFVLNDGWQVLKNLRDESADLMRRRVREDALEEGRSLLVHGEREDGVDAGVDDELEVLRGNVLEDALKKRREDGLQFERKGSRDETNLEDMMGLRVPSALDDAPVKLSGETKLLLQQDVLESLRTYPEGQKASRRRKGERHGRTSCTTQAPYTSNESSSMCVSRTVAISIF